MSGENASWVSRIGGDNNSLKVGINRVISEGASMAAFSGVGYIMDNVYDFKPFKQMVSHVVEPVVGGLDTLANALPALESDEETQTRHMLSRKERAYHYSDIAVDFGFKFAAGFLTQTFTQKILDDITIGGDLPQSAYLASTRWDKTVQLGSVILLNTLLSKPNEQVQDSIQGVMEKQLDMPEERANTIARDLINMHIPNLAGAATSIALLCNSHSAHIGN